MKKVIHLINESIKYILNLLLFVMVMVVFAQVLIRYMFDHPLAWSEELARYLLVWITFLGAAYAMSKQAHVGVEVFVKLFPVYIQKGMLLLATFISLFFFSVLIYQGYLFTLRTMAQTSPVLHLPMGGVYSIIPISGLLLIINLLYSTEQEWKNKG